MKTGSGPAPGGTRLRIRSWTTRTARSPTAGRPPAPAPSPRHRSAARRKADLWQRPRGSATSTRSPARDRPGGLRLPGLGRYGDGQVVPAVAGVQEPVARALLLAREEDQEPA